MNREKPELQDVEGPKSIEPPPTEQTTGPKWTIFEQETPLGNLSRGSIVIFDFSTISRDTQI